MKSAWAYLQMLEVESFIKIVTGSVPLDDFDKYVKEWNEQGGTQIISEIESNLK